MLALWVHASDKRSLPYTEKCLFIASSCDFTEPIYYLVPCYSAQHNPNEYCYFWKWWKFTVNCSMHRAESCCHLLPYISLILGGLQTYRNRCYWILQFYCLCTSWSDLVTDTSVDLEEYRAYTCKQLVTLSVFMHGEGKNSKYITGLPLNLLKNSSPGCVQEKFRNFSLAKEKKKRRQGGILTLLTKINLWL